MSHDIQNNELAYVGTTPWHGLGVQLEPGAGPQQMLEAAHLDWNVVCRPAFTFLNERPVETGQHAILREDTGHCFGIAHDTFTPVQNTEMVDFFQEFCHAGDLALETVGAVRGGEYVWALAKLNADHIDIDGDVLKNYLLIANSHVPGHALVIKSTMIRVVCNNTLTFALNEADKPFGRFVHNPRIHDHIQHAAEYVRDALDARRDIKRQVESLIARHVSESEARKILSRILRIKPDGKKMGQILNLFRGNQLGGELDTVQDTAWGLLNAVTEHIDHQVGRGQDSRLCSAWFGQGEKHKQSVFRTLLDLPRAA